LCRQLKGTSPKELLERKWIDRVQAKNLNIPISQETLQDKGIFNPIHVQVHDLFSPHISPNHAPRALPDAIWTGTAGAR